MGGARQGRGDQVGGRTLTGPAARVVPNVPSFSADDGFWYSVPEQSAGTLSVGSVVRIPLGGRRVRGWVVESTDREDSDLKPILGVSGSFPVFDEDLLTSLRWAAQHYVAPVSVMLAKSAPPNLGRLVSQASREQGLALTRPPGPWRRSPSALEPVNAPRHKPWSGDGRA